MTEEYSGAVVVFVPDLPEDLVVPGGLPVDDLHVTMVYLTDDHTTLTLEHYRAIYLVMHDLAVMVEAPVTGVHTLGDGDPAATVLLLDSPELQELRPVLKAALQEAGVPVPEDTYPEFLPHITVGYGTPLEDAERLVGQRVTLGAMAAWYGANKVKVYAPERETKMAQTWSGVLTRLGTPTGDGRIIAPNALTSRDLPLPLMYQRTSDGGHMGSVVVGVIEELDFEPDMVIGRGVLLDSVPETAEVMELIRAGVTGPSVDLDDLEYVMIDDETLVITQARVAGATLVSIPAFAEVSITLGGDSRPMSDEEARTIGEALFASAGYTVPALAGDDPRSTLPSLEWFAKPPFTGLTPLTVTPEGRVYGHVAGWETCHVGLPGCVTAPSSPSGYSYFLTGEQRMASGEVLPVGTLTVGGGHASPELGFQAAVAHYDDVGAAVARVNAGEDEYGIWVAGWLLPWASDEQRAQFVSSPVSGDWRRIGGALELIAVCSVNTPGFPVPRTRARVGFRLGAQRTLQMALCQPVAGDVPADLGIVVKTTDDQGRARWAWSSRKGR